MPKIISIRGHIGLDVRPSDVMAQLAEAKGKPVRVEFNSPGGFVYAGIDIHNMLRDYPGKTEAVIMSLAASMGSYIPLACDKIIAHDNAVFMIHNALIGAQGNHNDLRKAANYMENVSNLLAKAYVARTGKTLNEVKALMDAETFFFGAEIKEAGFIDEIMEAPEDSKHKGDKANAVIEARVSIEQVFNAMKEHEAANQDHERAAAYLAYNVPEATQGEMFDSGSELEPANMEWPEADYEAAQPVAFEDIEAPFPNEHACRIRKPGEFQKDSFRRISRKADGKTLDIIIGRLKGKTTTTTQAFRYPKDEWDVEAARKHCTSNKGILFEPAEKAEGDCPDCGNTPASAGKINEEGTIMTPLEKLLGENPGAKAEHDDLVAKAKKLGREEGEKALQEKMEKVSPILASGYYPKPIKELAVKVVKGEEDVSALTAATTSFDSTKEGMDLKAAYEEQAKLGETPPQGGQPASPSEDGEVKDEEGYQGMIAEMQGKTGGEGDK
jgi:ATP-dependent Clp endopeptidase proteolytic subunit ClpP